MAIGNIIYSTSSSTIATNGTIDASDFERSTNLQVDTISGNLIIAGGINTSGSSTIGSLSNFKITGGTNLLSPVIYTDGSSNLSWGNSKISTQGLGQGSGFSSKTLLTGNDLGYKRIVINSLLSASTGSGTYSLTFQTSSGTISSGYSGMYAEIYKTSAGATPTRNVQNWSGTSAVLGRKIAYSLLKIKLVLTDESTNSWQIQTRNVSYTTVSSDVLHSFSNGYVTLNNRLLNVTLVPSSGTLGYSYLGHMWE